MSLEFDGGGKGGTKISHDSSRLMARTNQDRYDLRNESLRSIVCMTLPQKLFLSRFSSCFLLSAKLNYSISEKSLEN